MNAHRQVWGLWQTFAALGEIQIWQAVKQRVIDRILITRRDVSSRETTLTFIFFTQSLLALFKIRFVHPSKPTLLGAAARHILNFYVFLGFLNNSSNPDVCASVLVKLKR